MYHHLCNSTDSSKDESTQYAASTSFIRKSHSTVQLIKDWMDAAKVYNDISDEKYMLDLPRNYHDNRHDQSLLSLMILKCRYGEPQKQEYQWTCLGDWSVQTFRI